MVAMVAVVGLVDWVVVLLLMELERTDVQGQVENVDEGRKRHAVDAVSVNVWWCWSWICDSESGRD
jgi:hypothetical protein